MNKKGITIAISLIVALILGIFILLYTTGLGTKIWDLLNVAVGFSKFDTDKAEVVKQDLTEKQTTQDKKLQDQLLPRNVGASYNPATRTTLISWTKSLSPDVVRYAVSVEPGGTIDGCNRNSGSETYRCSDYLGDSISRSEYTYTIIAYTKDGKWAVATVKVRLQPS